jgi:hypothetical protein
MKLKNGSHKSFAAAVHQMTAIRRSEGHGFSARSQGRQRGRH